ncbi:MAG: hypothetical protein IJ086_10715 [Clostridium sp.]|nr:hypothetical protein [Clostridium sp.]
MRTVLKKGKIYSNGYTFSIVPSKISPLNLKKYKIRIQLNNKANDSIYMNAYDFIYGLLEEKEIEVGDYRVSRILVNEISFENKTVKKEDLWCSDYFIITDAARIISLLKRLLVETIPSEIIKVYDYIHTRQVIELYHSSYWKPEKARQLIREYGLWCDITSKEYDALISEYKPCLSGVLESRLVRSGGEFYGCYRDHLDRKRPLTSPVSYSSEYNKRDLLEFVAITDMPPILLHYFTLRYMPDDDIMKFFDNKDQLLEFVNKYITERGLKVKADTLNDFKLAVMAKIALVSHCKSFIKVRDYLFGGTIFTRDYLNIYKEMLKHIDMKELEEFTAKEKSIFEICRTYPKDKVIPWF